SGIYYFISHLSSHYVILYIFIVVVSFSEDIMLANIAKHFVKSMATQKKNGTGQNIKVYEPLDYMKSPHTEIYAKNDIHTMKIIMSNLIDEPRLTEDDELEAIRTDLKLNVMFDNWKGMSEEERQESLEFINLLIYERKNNN